ncbi:hypothetical protein [Glutamicibacter sp. TV12E]|uniref:hypothetical protein n=1 Tax=Glutamicibacter sp. TV12E TaxID=3446362 RepID=UPI0040333531
MTTMIEARRLNGTDLGKKVGAFGVLQAVAHRVVAIQAPEEHEQQLQKVVVIEASAGTFMVWPSSKVEITAVYSPEVKP